MILRSGERAKFGSEIPFGTALDVDGNPVYEEVDGAPSSEWLISNAPDFTSLLTVSA